MKQITIITFILLIAFLVGFATHTATNDPLTLIDTNTYKGAGFNFLPV